VSTLVCSQFLTVEGSKGSSPEAEVIRRAQQGNAQAFERLYKLHSKRIFNLCLRMIGDRAEAEDLAQESFLQLFRKIHTFRGESAFSTWLHRQAFNVVLIRLRKKRIAESSLEEMTEPDEGRDKPRCDFGAQDAVLSGAIDRVVLERAVQQLAAGYRSVFLLHDVWGYEHQQVAQILECSVGNSKSQLHKARLRLRKILQTGNPHR
jgi:RNA polymerase sigma-70 factor (ECF subfamily)